MTQEDRELLLKDLCARLPYILKVNVHVIGSSYNEDRDLKPEIAVSLLVNDDICIKPYLRPMSSMTEEEFEVLKQYSGLVYDQLDLAEFPNNHKCLDFYLSEIPSYAVIQVFDWLNAHHFDYRLLIERGLALEASEDMYKNK